MAKETVEAVRQAELNAAKLEREAALKRDAILQKASEDAKLLISTKTKEALEHASKELHKADLEGEKLMDLAVKKAEQEINLLKELVKQKENTAIDLVLKEVI